jgi:adenylyltransferase/sulfurtransferase
LGYGFFRWADVVVGAVDNREARVFINSACARVDRPWIDGGLDVLQGVVRGFHPPGTACYECTMSEVDWAILNRRRSCSLLAQRAVNEQGAATTPTVASVIGALQVQEVIKYLHDMDCLLGVGYVFEGAQHSSYKVVYPKSPDCPWHDPASPIEVESDWGSETTLRSIWEETRARLRSLRAIEFARDIIEQAECPACGFSRPVWRYVESASEQDVLCERCGTECGLSFTHEIRAGSEFLDLTVAELGLPPWEIVWARDEHRTVGIELAKDRPSWATDATVPS